MLRRMVNSYRRFVGPLCLHVQSRVQEGRTVRASLLGMIWRECGAQPGNSAYRSTTSRHIITTHDRSGAGKSSWPRWQDARLLLTARPGICLTGQTGSNCARALVIFKTKQCDTTQSSRAGFIFKIVEVHGRFRRTKNEKNVVRFSLIGFNFFAIKCGICLISAFRCEVDGNCALLGYFIASSGNLLPTFRDRLSKGP